MTPSNKPEMRVAMLLLGAICGKCFAAKDVVTIVNLMISGGKVPYPYLKAAPAIDIAMEKLKEMVSDRVDVNYVRLLYPPPCDANHVAAMVAQVRCEHNVSVLIGPGCSLAAEVVGRMAASWNIPMISPVATNSNLGNKQDFSTLTRLFHNWNKWANMYLSLFQWYGWTDIAIIYDTNHVFFLYQGTGLAAAFVRDGLTVFSQSYLSTRTHSMEKLLMNASRKSRVFILAMNSEQLRKTMLLAYRLEMTSGDYVFISARGSTKVAGATGNLHWRLGDEFDVEARKAYEAVLITQVRRPNTAGFVAFEKEVIRRALRDYNYTYGAAVFEAIPVFHDAVMLYAHVLNETLTLGEDYQDGRFLNSKIWGKIFTGISGDIPIDEQGDREMDFSLVDIDPVTGDYQVVANYFGIHKGITFEEGVSVHWPNNGHPPPNMPLCWFKGDNPVCHPQGLSGEMVFGIVVSVSFLVFAVITLSVYRKVKSESDLQSQWWKIKWCELHRSVVNSRMGSNVSSGVQSTLRPASSTEGIDNPDVVLYKGVSVTIRKLNVDCVNIDRTTLTELRQMRDVQCANLTRFLGMCLESPNICLITEHCTRGSLQDMLHNDAIKLDNDFKMSLLHDVILGMRYVHGSPIQCHGRLNSGNCLIDSRFVLKITDHGLPSIRRQDQTRKTYNKQGLLYVAPEHLRDDPLNECSQAGDVYSFSILLHEVLTRTEPFEDEMDTYTITDLLNQIKRAEPPLRPKQLTADLHPELLSLMRDCWQEDPGNRPSFGVIRKRYREKLQSLTGKNILDTLLLRMEQYADNLEGLVEERTHAFLEEKRKSEALLLEILPRSVAEKLKNGVPVDPEAFDGVTIYFSDIVGFTNISSHSTPFQVIDLLNDLYTCFDTIINNFDVYKVETIGDAYMVVSGLPVRNGHNHVVHIARMSLSILRSLDTFKIRHMPATPLRARIGLHTGSVCSGVVGQKMPRYCLFGDTVNTASRLESTGEALKIHISEPTKCLLSKMGNFHIEERGEIDVKGKGKMRTFWLMAESSEAVQCCLTPVSL